MRPRRRQILATGIQALVRLPIDLMRADRAKGWNTAGFISGYQGSPLGGYDRELQSQRKLLDELNIVHVPGLNEELAATSIFGSQVAQTYARPKYEGVAAVWYGKSPGLDRAGDAIRHGSFGGTARKGGVVLLVGDDAAAKSSTLPSRSDPTLVALHLPVFYPGTVQEVLDLGFHAFAMSRLTGLWVAMKITTPVADGSGIAEVAPDRVRTRAADRSRSTESHGSRPSAGTSVCRLPTPWRSRCSAIASSGPSDTSPPIRSTASSPTPPMPGWESSPAVTTCTRSWKRCVSWAWMSNGSADLGVRVLKLGALHPLDHGAIRELANGTATVMVCEDKIDFLESRVRSVLYGSANAPAVIGKYDHDGKPLITHYGALTIDNLVDSLRRVLTLRVPADQLATVRKLGARAHQPRCRSHAHTVLLLGLPAQHRPARARGLIGRCRHRLSRHGQHRSSRADRRSHRHHPDGRRGRAVDRHGAVRGGPPLLPEHGRRHLLPQWSTRCSGSGRLRHDDDVQDPLQRAPWR